MPDPLYMLFGLLLLPAGFFGARALLHRRNRSRYGVREFPDFFSAEECEHLIELARPLIRNSGVVRKGESRSNSALRTSDSAFLTNANDAITKRLKRRLAELTQTDLRCQEPLQVTHYHETEFYVPHRDALVSGGIEVGLAGDRHCTVIVYLNDDYSGGYTRFHKIATRVKPERGKAVFFYNLTEDGTRPHPLSLHGAEPVTSGEKWLVNQWIRERPFDGGRNRKARRASGQRRSNRISKPST